MKKTMKNIPIIFILMLAMNFFSLPYGHSEDSLKIKNISARDVNKISFNIYEKNKLLGQATYEGYILFYDQNGKQCAVSSNNRPVIIWIGEGADPVPSERHAYVLYKDIDVNTQNFQVFKLRSGETVIGLKIKPFTVTFKKFSEKNTISDSRKKYTEFIPKFKMYWEVGNGKIWKKEVNPLYAY